MNSRRLRQQRNWSQEQLAKFSGLSLRTIQRIESGRNTSLESWKSLAAVFEVEIAALEQEIVVIDKKSSSWKEHPLWVRVWFLGSNKIEHRRKDVIKIEIFCLTAAILLFLLTFMLPVTTKAGLLQTISVMLIFGAYGMSVTTRLGDKYAIW